MPGWLLAARHENLTIWLSVFAVGISLFSLGWNVYRDVILKPRFRVGLRIAERPPDMSRQGAPVPWWTRNPNGTWVPYLELSVVNRRQSRYTRQLADANLLLFTNLRHWRAEVRIRLA